MTKKVVDLCYDIEDCREKLIERYLEGDVSAYEDAVSRVENVIISERQASYGSFDKIVSHMMAYLNTGEDTSTYMFTRNFVLTMLAMKWARLENSGSSSDQTDSIDDIIGYMLLWEKYVV